MLAAVAGAGVAEFRAGAGAGVGTEEGAGATAGWLFAVHEVAVCNDLLYSYTKSVR